MIGFLTLAEAIPSISKTAILLPTKKYSGDILRFTFKSERSSRQALLAFLPRKRSERLGKTDN